MGAIQIGKTVLPVVPKQPKVKPDAIVRFMCPTCLSRFVNRVERCKGSCQTLLRELVEPMTVERFDALSADDRQDLRTRRAKTVEEMELELKKAGAIL